MYLWKKRVLETETSFFVILEKARAGLKAGRASRMKTLSVEHLEEASDTIIAAAREGDRYAVELFSEAGYNIGRGVAILIHLLNPEVIILSGRGSSAGKIWQPPINRLLMSIVFQGFLPVPVSKCPPWAMTLN